MCSQISRGHCHHLLGVWTLSAPRNIMKNNTSVFSIHFYLQTERQNREMKCRRNSTHLESRRVENFAEEYCDTDHNHFHPQWYTRACILSRFHAAPHFITSYRPPCSAAPHGVYEHCHHQQCMWLQSLLLQNQKRSKTGRPMGDHQTFICVLAMKYIKCCDIQYCAWGAGTKT